MLLTNSPLQQIQCYCSKSMSQIQIYALGIPLKALITVYKCLNFIVFNTIGHTPVYIDFHYNFSFEISKRQHLPYYTYITACIDISNRFDSKKIQLYNPLYRKTNVHV